MFRKFTQVITLFIIALLGFSLVAPASASAAAFPGVNGRILYFKDGAFRTANSTGADQQNAPSSISGSGYKWSPDGSRIAFHGWNTSKSIYTIWIMNSDGSELREIPNTDRGQDPQWNADGLSLFFTEPQASPNQAYSQLVRINIDGSHKTLIYYYVGGDISANGNRLAMTGAESSMFPYVNIYNNIQLPLGNPTKTSESAYYENISGHEVACPAWSPNASKLLFIRTEDNNPNNTEIKILNTATKAVERTLYMIHVGLYALSSCPIWSPDGNSIAFVGYQNVGDYMQTPAVSHLYTFNLNTNATSKIINNVQGLFAWQPLSNPMLYRLANWKTHERLFTTNPYEVLSAQKNDSGWVYEGVSSKVYNSADSNRVPVYRLANWITHERLFTTDQAEANHATQNLAGWVYEGIAFYASTSTSDTAMHRMANWKTHERLFTTDLAEVNHAVSNYEGWVYEGKAFYVPVQ